MNAFLYAYDQVNLGDDLFIEMLLLRYPKVQFYMWSVPENRKVFANLKNLHILDPNGWFPRLLRTIRPSFAARWEALPKDMSDCCVYIGGSIFQEYDTWPNIVNWWQYHSRKYPFYVLGANFGPWQTEAYRDGMAEAFGNLKDLCFRDRYSHEQFPDRSRLAPDILFGQTFPNAEPKKQIFLSVIDCASGPNGLSQAAQRYEQCLTEIAAEHSCAGYDVVLASFCKAEGDEEACLRLQKALQKRGVESRLLFYTGYNRQQMLQQLKASEMVVGTRFHACVLGLAAGRRVLPVLYSDKTGHMLSDIGFDGPVLDLREDIKPVSSNELEKSTVCTDAAALALAAEAHFQKLDDLLISKK